MSKRSKISRKSILAFAALFLLLFFITHLQARTDASLYDASLFAGRDTIITDTALQKLRTDTGALPHDTIPQNSNIINAPDSLFFKDTANGDTSRKQRIDSFLISKDTLDSPIEYSAEDSGVLNIETRKFYLYGKANAKNKDIDLTANNIQYDQSNQVVKAFGGIDTSNNPLSKPTLVQSDQTSISDTILFNLKTQRGLSKNSYYNEGELYVNAEKVKKTEKDVAFAYRSRFTTCNLDTPHFAFIAKRMKLINNKIAVSGPAHPEFEGVPIPIYIPFGIYPLNRGRHSGLLPAQFTNNNGYGLGIEGLGYYKVINDNWDVTTRGNIYSYGGWTMTVTPEYYKRYKYRGTLNLDIQHSKILNTSSYGFSKDEFTKSQNYSLRWSHSQDTKAHPGTSFQASVNASTTSYNKYVPNNPIRSYSDLLTSSITYSKTWDQGKYNLSVGLNHNQNNQKHIQNISFPTVSFTANTIYPFERKELIGTPKWYEKLGISYNGQLLNQFSFYDTAFNFRHVLDTLQYGVQHNIPISLSLPALGPFIISPFVSYSERWFGQINEIKYDEAANKVDTIQHKQFNAAREVSFGASLNTRIFGTLQFPHSKSIVAIRHEIKPTVSFSYKPDLVSQYYKDIPIKVFDTSKTTGKITDTTIIHSVSLLGGNLFSPYGRGRFGGLTFSLDNLLEMKLRNKNDSTGENPTRKVKLIDGLNLTTSYNFLADSMRWSPISIGYRSTFFQKVNVTGSAIIDPYETNKYGQDLDKLLWKKGKIGRLTSASFAVSTSIQSKRKDGKTDDQRLDALDETLTPDEQAAALAYVRSNPADFVDFDIPWSLNLSFTTNFSRRLKINYSGYYTDITSSLNVNGDFSLTPKWKIGGSTYYDVRHFDIGLLTMYITREMHCWQLSINLTPVGRYRSFSITINPKSSLLRDLKINRTRSFTDY